MGGEKSSTPIPYLEGPQPLVTPIEALHYKDQYRNLEGGLIRKDSTAFLAELATQSSNLTWTIFDSILDYPELQVVAERRFTEKTESFVTVN